MPLLPLLLLLAQCIIAHLENADVGRLLRIFQYVQRYEADWEVAWLQAEQKAAEERKNEPMMDEDMMGECATRCAVLCCAVHAAQLDSITACNMVVPLMWCTAIQPVNTCCVWCHSRPTLAVFGAG